MKPLFLVGYMGCGKSTLGRKLARRLGVGFVDTDALVEEQAVIDGNFPTVESPNPEERKTEGPGPQAGWAADRSRLGAKRGGGSCFSRP